jgi:large subunit ribosomal protein L1
MPIPVPPNADIAALVKKHRKTVVVRMRNQPIIQVSVGTQQMKDEELVDNTMAVLRVLDGKLKRGLKNVKYAFLKTSMGEPIKIKP